MMNSKEIETTVYEIARIVLARSHHNRCREEILEELDITDTDAEILQQNVEEHQRGAPLQQWGSSFAAAVRQRVMNENTVITLGCPTSPKFPLGSVVATANFIHKAEKLGEDPNTLIKIALSKHALGDWGECCDTDARANDGALKSGEERLHSVYRTKGGQKFWVITEWDRSVTTVLLPEDY